MNQFFSETNGLSSSEANHVANIASELVQSAEENLARTSVTKLEVILNGVNHPIKLKNFDSKTVTDNIAVRPRLFQLSAWLRYAVKLKEKMLNEVDFPVEFSEVMVNPPHLNLVDEEWAKAQLTIKELAEFLSYEAEAAAYGHYIHNNGLLKLWQKELSQPLFAFDRDKNPIVTAERTDPAEVDSLFFELQKKHRESEQKCNYYKAKLKNMVALENTARTNKYSAELSEYKKAYNQFESNSHIAESNRTNKIIEEKKRISALKIIIPEQLQNTLDFVQSYSK